MATVCTWALGAATVAAGTATLAAIDPAKPSVTIALMMMVRPMCMSPPWLLPRSAARCMTPAARKAHLNNLGLIADLRQLPYT